DVLNPGGGDDLPSLACAAVCNDLSETGKISRSCADATGTPRRAQSVDRDIPAVLRTHRLPNVFAHQVGKSLTCRPLNHPAQQVRIRRDVVETASMLAIRGQQAPVKRPQVRRTLAWLKRMPVGRFSIFDDRTGGRRVVFIESDANSHVEKMPDRGSSVGCF